MCKKPEEVKTVQSSKDEILTKERETKKSNSPEFYWDDNIEPHVERRTNIVGKYPEIKKLFGPSYSTKYVIVLTLFFQLFTIYTLTKTSASCWVWFYLCYTISGSLNHMMTLAIHELSHNLGSKKPVSNRIWALIANLSMGIPAAASFRRYHLEHHRYQGEDEVDVDIPTNVEGWIFTRIPSKTLWCILQPLFYSLRPAFVSPKQPSFWEIVNISLQLIFDAAVFFFFGIKGVAYLAFGTLFGMGIHPVAGHFIAEHYVMHNEQETYSYYGPLNWLAFNVGYHNEHHDFPFVSGRKLPFVRHIASEFYDDIPHYHSWIKVIYDYIVDDKISPFSRTRRVTLTNQEIQGMRARGGLIK